MAMASSDHLQCWLVRVRGRVQGVGYREACVRHARSLGITGWVRNRMDDSVEATLQGPRDKLQAMCDWMRDDMPSALVDDQQVSVIEPPFPRFDAFERWPTM
jgi:acylphosphatase